jgi:hypothetical protein
MSPESPHPVSSAKASRQIQSRFILTPPLSLIPSLSLFHFM